MKSYAYDHFYVLLPLESSWLSGKMDSLWEVRIKQNYPWDIIHLVESAITDLVRNLPSILSDLY